MKKILTIQNISCEPLGSLEEDAGNLAEFRYVRPYRGEPVPGDLAGWDAAIILGGPMAVYEAEEQPFIGSELELLRQAVVTDFPVLGICLGSQLIAAAGGGRVYAGHRREAGWGQVSLTEAAGTDALFGGLPSPLPVFQIHGDTFDLPAGAVSLAGNDIYPSQAFRLGSRMYGLQFHLEVTAALVRDWVRIYDDYIAGAGIEPASLLDDLEARCRDLRAAARQIIDRFLEL